MNADQGNPNLLHEPHSALNEYFYNLLKMCKLFPSYRYNFFFHKYPNKITGSYSEHMDIKEIGFHGNLIHNDSFQMLFCYPGDISVILTVLILQVDMKYMT